MARMQRRSWLKLGMAAAAVLAVGGGAVALFEPGVRSGRLSTSGRLVFGNLARAFLDGVLPTETSELQAALAAFLVRVDTLVEHLPAHAQQELSQLLALLATPVGRRGLAGLQVDWAQASIPQMQAALQSMRTSPLSLRRQAYLALHDITGAAYFSDRSTWAVLGYPGPVAV
jgi:hypothetical protein